MSSPRAHLAAAVAAPLLATTAATPTLLAQDTYTLDPSWAYPAGSGDAAQPGFAGRIHQARKDSGLTATIARGNAQLNGTLIDPQTDQPYVNVVVDDQNPEFTGGAWFGTTPVQPGGTFVHDGMINFTADQFGEAILETGNFDSFFGEPYTDQFFPGLPGSSDDFFFVYDNGQNFAVEFVAYLDLPAGQTVIGIHHDDAVELAFHPNDARDIFRDHALGFDSNSNETDRTVILDVAEAGLYPVRLLLAQWTGIATLELYTADPFDPFLLTLVNDPDEPTSIKAYRAVTAPPRPHVTAVSPAQNATGVEGGSAVSVTVENLGAAQPVMKIGGTQVTYTASTQGTTTTLTHTPPVPFASGQTVQVELAYGNATAAWSYVVKTGAKALLITGQGQLNASDGWVANRLATRFGLDVVVVSDARTTVADADGAVLVFNSSTVNSGNVANDDFETLPVPLINVESANVDDFVLTDGPFAGKYGNNPFEDEVVIENADHPLAAGLPLGTHAFATGNVQFHRAEPGANAIVIATTPNFPERGAIFAYEKGASVLLNDGFTEFIHPARRIHFGHTGNEGAAIYNATGVALFDAAVAWALADPDAPEPSTPLRITAVTRDAITGEVSLTFTTEPGATYRLHGSTDLVTWTELDDTDATTESATLSPTSATPHRYYRIERAD